MRATQRLDRTRLPADAVRLARYLLGKVLVRQRGDDMLTARIVETEAYLPGDPACHAYRGMTDRNRSLFLGRGHAYVYLCYGTSYMLNVASGPAGVGCGVLLRAAEPLLGLALMRHMREHVREADVVRGPGRLCAAFGVDRRFDGVDLCADPQLWLGSDGYRVTRIGTSVRIGITKGADLPLRFFLPGSRYLSGARSLNSPS